ncbi:MAG: trimethylamine corrinoid protein 2 [Lachnospiraceae bacterium]
MKYKKNWKATQEKWEAYWQRQNTGRPLMCVWGQKEEARNLVLEEQLRPVNMYDKYQDAKRIVERFRYFCDTHEFLGESFPNLSLDFGPGSLASYLGCDIVFNEDTVWFTEFVEDWLKYPDLQFNQENEWFKKHVALFKEVKSLAGDDFLIGIPDLMENIDVLASMRGAQNTLYDMIDEPEEISRRIGQINNLYQKYYDTFYEIVKDEQGASCYTVFQIWGKGKTVKLQCDFSAMMSPANVREFIQDSLRQQARGMDNILYHLDGPDAIKHVDALMEIEEIDALQWSSGDYGPDGTFEEWYPIYDKAIAAGKGLWVKVYSGEFEEWLERLDKLIARYGTKALFLFFDPMPLAQASKLLEYAEKHWCDIEGEYTRTIAEQNF